MTRASAVGFEFDVILAILLGGTSLPGGKGSVIGTLIGALIVAVLGNGMDMLNILTFWQSILKGVIFVFAIVINEKVLKKSARQGKGGHAEGWEGMKKRQAILPLSPRRAPRTVPRTSRGPCGWLEFLGTEGWSGAIPGSSPPESGVRSCQTGSSYPPRGYLEEHDRGPTTSAPRSCRWATRRCRARTASAAAWTRMEGARDATRSTRPSSWGRCPRESVVILEQLPCVPAGASARSRSATGSRLSMPLPGGGRCHPVGSWRRTPGTGGEAARRPACARKASP